MNLDDFIVNAGFDNNYSDVSNPIEKILFPLCYIGIGIPLIMIYYIYFYNPPRIYPYDVANYIHAQHQNIIDDTIEKNNLRELNRWNCDKRKEN